jgi:hypothetical protein
VMMMLPLPAAAVTWGPERTVTDEPHQIGPNAMAESSAAISIAFRTDAGIFVSRSVDGGTTWLAPVQLSASAETIPALDASGATVDAVWSQLGDDGRYRVMHRRSSDDGVTWSPAVSLVRSGNPLGVPSVGREADRVAIAWSNLGTGRVYAAVSVDGGATWGSADIIGVTSHEGTQDGPFTEALPDVAVATQKQPGDDIHRIYVSWNQWTDIPRVARSADDGATWTNRSKGFIGDTTTGTSIVAKGSVVILGYTRDVHGEYSESTRVEVRRSTNGGHSWYQDEIRLSELGKPWSDSLVLSFRDNTLRAAFTRCINAGCAGDGKQVLYTESTNGGRAWSSPVRVFRAASAQGTPVGVDIADGALIVAYRACTEDSEGQVCEVRVRQGS